MKTQFVTAENASEVMDDKMSDLVDLMAFFPRIKPDPKAWEYLLIYASEEDLVKALEFKRRPI